ncbi:hypothetical protein AAG906_004419 [Vitis piasezkii]
MVEVSMGSNDILVDALGAPEYSEVLAKLSQVEVVTPHSDVSSLNMKQKQLFLPEVVEKPIRRVEDATPPMPIEPQSKVRKCELAMETKENKVGGGTIILECGPNYLVVVDVPYDASAPLSIPILRQTTTVGTAIGYQVLWPTHLVTIHTLSWKCPRQPGSVEYGYYVMRYMKEIIASSNQLTTKVLLAMYNSSWIHYMSN